MANTEPTGDKRSVSTDALATLGTIIDDKQKRDAIHLAVEPVIAGSILYPGDRIFIKDGVAFLATTGGSETSMGIVDPFVTTNILKGQRFWFVMNPRMVHSLRHVWTHPAFPDEVGTPSLEKQPDKAESEAWLRSYANMVNPYLVEGEYSNPQKDPDLAYNTLLRDLRRGELTYHGRDMHSQDDLIEADELQRHASIVLGRPVIWSDFEYFSCYC